MADFLEAVGEEGVWGVTSRFDDHSAACVCWLAVADLRVAAGTEPPIRLFRGELQGSIVPPRGDVRHGARSWNSSFLPTGLETTFGEMSYEEQASMSHRRSALAALVAGLGLE